MSPEHLITDAPVWAGFAGAGVVYAALLIAIALALNAWDRKDK